MSSGYFSASARQALREEANVDYMTTRTSNTPGRGTIYPEGKSTFLSEVGNGKMCYCATHDDQYSSPLERREGKKGQEARPIGCGVGSWLCPTRARMRRD